MKKVILSLVIIIFSGIVHGQDYTYDRQLGEESAKQVEMLMGLYPDSALNVYVDQVGSQLVNALGDSPFQFEFQIADMAEPNAFALPGGFIYVSRGLLSLVNEEAELAGVLGHEMIHVTKRHSIKQMKKSIWPSILMIPGAIVGGLVDEDLGNIINTPISLGSDLFLMNYSRRQEKEADLFGVVLASEAGYDPSKLATILNHLSLEMEHVSGEAEKRSYFSSHPFTPKRIEDLGEKVETIDWESSAPIVKNREELYSRLEGMYVGQNPQQGIFEENRFLHPDLNLSIQFPQKWETANVPIAVGAFEEDGKAQIILSLEEAYTTADSAADAFVQKFHEMSGKKPQIIDSIDINGFKARRISIVEKQTENTIVLNAWWIEKDKYLLNLTGISYANNEADVLATASSLKSLTQAEKAAITSLQLQTEKAFHGESIADFCARTNNAWDVAETALINGIPEEQPLEEGQVLKIAVETPYF